MLPPLAAFFSLAGAVLGQITGDTIRWAQASGVDYGTALGEALGPFPRQLKEQPLWILFRVIAAYVGFGFVNSRVRSARELLAASSLPPRDETECGDDFAPRKQA